MTRGQPITLSTPAHELAGVGPATASALRELGLSNVGRLIAHLPMRHEWHAGNIAIALLRPDTVATTEGLVTAVRLVRGKRTRFEAVVMEGRDRLDVVWFNAAYLARRLQPGQRLRVHGTVRQRGPGLQMVNPRTTFLKDEPDAAGSLVATSDREAGADASAAQGGSGELVPVYPASERLASAQIRAIIAAVLDEACALIQEQLADSWREERGLVSLATAYRAMHRPTGEEDVARARRRLAYDELMMLQVGVALKRAHRRRALRAPVLRMSGAIDRHIRQRLPFALTSFQDEVVAEVARDLSQEVPANRLVQGDVGSGKTVVALYAMLQAVASGHQAALMAPTEILAEQHEASLARMLAGSSVRVALLTGATPPAERAVTIGALAAREIDIVIGTHALLTADVRFKSLAVVVIDEQHRFGVEQRAQLREKPAAEIAVEEAAEQGAGAGGVEGRAGSRSAADERTLAPHTIVMTATPIPRTLAMSVLGDLDVSSIRGLPPGRTPIATRVFSRPEREGVYRKLRERIDAGERAYVVSPVIESADEPGGGLVGVRELEETLSAGALAGVRIGVVHGRLRRATRDAAMERFRAGQIRCLIATTVIEVGVDVPEATLMVIEHAERFGLSQLHQLRGRVGRGGTRSECWLIADAATDEARERIAAIAQIDDGFALAEKDFELRGPGELFGTAQSGRLPLKVADLRRDVDLLRLARRDAEAWVAGRQSGAGATVEDEVLLRRMRKQFGDALGLADVA